MRVVDTSAWIEWITRSPLHAEIVPLLPERYDWLVPTMVQLELAKWLARERLDEDRAEEILAFSSTCLVIDLTTPIALAAADLARRLAVADAVIYATAREFGADLLTCDEHFSGLPNVIHIPKTGRA